MGGGVGLAAMTSWMVGRLVSVGVAAETTITLAVSSAGEAGCIVAVANPAGKGLIVGEGIIMPDLGGK